MTGNRYQSVGGGSSQYRQFLRKRRTRETWSPRRRRLDGRRLAKRKARDAAGDLDIQTRETLVAITRLVEM